jgi:hypothetical protein
MRIKDSFVEEAREEAHESIHAIGKEGAIVMLLQADLRVTSGRMELLDGARRCLIVTEFDGTQHVTMQTNEIWTVETNLRHFTVSDHTLMWHVDHDGTEDESVRSHDTAMLALDTEMLPAHAWALEQRLMIFPRAASQSQPLQPPSPHAVPSFEEPASMTQGTTASANSCSTNSSYVLTLRVSAQPESGSSSQGPHGSSSQGPLDAADDSEDVSSSRTLAYDIYLKVLPYNVFLRRRIIDKLVIALSPPKHLKWHVAARKAATLERMNAWGVVANRQEEGLANRQEEGRRRVASEGKKDSEGFEGDLEEHMEGRGSQGAGGRRSPPQARNGAKKNRRRSLQQVRYTVF